ncbi:MFS transporter [Actinoplanes sp. NPDC026670]|uniref:MFS transporter n=1 Tax=Actinoplanes sp. NPDC026670 TaxID=3154700 RepID=UPI0033F1D978
MNLSSPRLRLLATAMTLDALGSGLFGPFGLLYAHEVAGLPLAVAGAAIGVAGTVALAAGPLAGALVDRLGPARVVVLANAVAVLGGLILLTARDLWVFSLASVLGVASARMFWSSFAPLVAAVTADRAERWLGYLRSARLAGVMLGGFAASVVLTLDRHHGLIIMLAVDTATYALAGVLTTVATAALRRTIPSASTAPPGRTAASAHTGRASYRTVLRDRALLRLTALNTACTLLVSAPVIAMPVYLIDSVHGPAWLPGLAAGLLTGLVALAMTRTPHLTRGTGRLRVLALACLLWSAGCLLFITAGSSPVPAALTATMVLALAQAFYEPTADAVPLALAPPHLTGRYTAVYQLAWGVSSALAPLLVGTLLSINPAALWITLAAIAATTAVAYHRTGAHLTHRVGHSGASLTFG